MKHVTYWRLSHDPTNALILEGTPQETKDLAYQHFGDVDFYNSTHDEGEMTDDDFAALGEWQP